jgi:hypothetical protein
MYFQCEIRTEAKISLQVCVCGFYKRKRHKSGREIESWLYVYAVSHRIGIKQQSAICVTSFLLQTYSSSAIFIPDLGGSGISRVFVG